MVTPQQFRDSLEQTTSLGVAVALARHGVAVFPCGADKAPRTSRGFKDATTDLLQVERWFSDGLGARSRVGVVPASAGLAVLDLDTVEGGLALAEAQVELHTGVERQSHPHQVRTPSGGCHLWFSIGEQPGPQVANSRWPAVDVRGDGGYVIVWSPDTSYRLDEWDLDPDADWELWPVPESGGSATRREPLGSDDLIKMVSDHSRNFGDSLGDTNTVRYVLSALDNVQAGSRHAAGLKALGRLFANCARVNLDLALDELRLAWMALPGPDEGRGAEWLAMVMWIAGQEAANSEPVNQPQVAWAPTPAGVRSALDQLGFSVRYNSRRQRIEVMIPEALRVAGQSDWEPAGDTVDALLVVTVAEQCDHNGRQPVTAMRKWREWLHWCLVGEPPVDPFVEWLDQLPEWDNTPRLENWLYVFEPAPDTADDVIRYVSRLIPMAVVKRALEPGCGADIMPVLVGPQGIGKSRGLRSLMAEPDWFSDSLSLQDELKVWVEKSLGPCLIEVAEMAGASRQETAKLKSILSATKDEVRLAYRRDTGEYLRRFFPVGTANDRRTLPNDPTGNRRFAVVNLIGNSAEYPTADDVVACLTENREQLFAEALRLVRSGAGLFPDKATRLELAAAAEGARIDDTEIEAVVAAFLETRVSKFHVGGLIRETKAWLAPERGEQVAPKSLDSRVIRALEHAGCDRDARKSRGRMEGDTKPVVRFWWQPPGGAVDFDSELADSGLNLDALPRLTTPTEF